MSEHQPRQWRFYVSDMITFTDKVIAYTRGFNQAEFVASSLNYDATVPHLNLIQTRPR